jgi:hypothetical protein
VPVKKLRKPKNTLFLLEAEIHSNLRKTAFEAGLSMAEALREAVQLWLRKKSRAGEEVKWDRRKRIGNENKS